MVNWTMLPHMSQIWGKLLERGIPNRTGKIRTLFVDLADPEKRNLNDIREAMQLLSRFQNQIDVVLGLNLKEAGEVCHVLGLSVGGNPEAVVEKTARAIRETLNLACVVVHPRAWASVACEATQSARLSRVLLFEQAENQHQRRRSLSTPVFALAACWGCHFE